jgi:hypothetical protein
VASLEEELSYEKLLEMNSFLLDISF